jgi:hypothetical protein
MVSGGVDIEDAVLRQLNRALRPTLTDVRPTTSHTQREPSIFRSLCSHSFPLPVSCESTGASSAWFIRRRPVSLRWRLAPDSLSTPSWPPVTGKTVTITKSVSAAWYRSRSASRVVSWANWTA